MAIATAHIVSHYAQPKPKGLHWSPRPLRLAKSHPLPSLRDRKSSAQPPTLPVAQPLVRVEDENHKEGPLVEAQEGQGALGQSPDGQLEPSGSEGLNSPSLSTSDLSVSQAGMSPEDFLRNALPVTHVFTQPTAPSSNRLEVTSPHRLRPSSSLSNISSGSTRSRPPSVISTRHVRRSSSRASGMA